MKGVYNVCSEVPGLRVFGIVASPLCCLVGRRKTIHVRQHMQNGAMVGFVNASKDLHLPALLPVGMVSSPIGDGGPD
jgi:hypothetical protein